MGMGAKSTHCHHKNVRKIDTDSILYFHWAGPIIMFSLCSLPLFVNYTPSLSPRFYSCIRI